MFGVEDFMIVVTKKWEKGKKNESESWVMMIWKNEKMANMCGWWQWKWITNHLQSHNTPFEFNERALKEECCTLNTQKKTQHTGRFFVFSFSINAFNAPPSPYLNKFE